MKKQIAFLFFTFHFLNSAISQDTTRAKKLSHIHSHASLSLSFGQGRPLGSFSSTNSNTTESPNQSRGYANGNCFADPGGVFNIELNLPIHKSCIGGTFNLGYNGNGFDSYNYSRFYIPAQNTATYATQISASASSYAIVTLLSGITFTPQIKKFSFDFKILTGPLFCSTPGIRYNQATPYNLTPWPGMSISTESLVWDSVTSASNISLAIEVGLGVNYHLCKNFYLMAGASYLYSKPTVQVKTDTYENSGGQMSLTSMVSSVTSSVTIPISLLNLTIGIKFLL